MNEKKSKNCFTAREIFALFCMALSCGAFIGFWLYLFFHPQLFWDAWIIADGMITWTIVDAFDAALPILLLIGPLLLGAIRLFFNDSFLSKVFIALTALPFLYAVLLSPLYMCGMGLPPPWAWP